MSTEQEQITALDSVRGRKGSHYALAEMVADLGLIVDPDGENNERSEIKLLGHQNDDGSDIVVGEILGDSEAVIR